MRLRSLELKGFKSFADKTVIHFNEDVIGIVGPNGSGKSNIVDAIRWVLGEQKKQELRLDKMVSVIFNGTKKRNPSGVASVSLTFDNTKNLIPTEYQTVTISRHLYRSGESEYRINDVACRLKDIRSLFLDTGIGSDSYAIIALGMVDDILHDKENSRRYMLEQASGILKYKIRKRETLNKLKNTEADLDRVEDLLFELNNQLKDLEKQARRTQRYFDLKEKYRNYSLDLAHYSVQALYEDYENIEKKKTQHEDAHSALRTKILELESKLEAEKKKQLDEEKSLSNKQKVVNDIVNLARERENDKKMARQNIDFARENLKRLKIQIENNSEELQKVEAEIREQKTQLEQEQSIETSQRKRFEEIENELNAIKARHGAVKGNMDNLLSSQQEAESEVIDKEKQLAVLQTKLDNNRLEEKQLNLDLQSRSAQSAEMKKALEDINQQVAIYQEKKNQLQELKEKRESRKQAYQDKEKELQDELIQINRRIDARKNELELLESMVNNLEGFPESVKFLAKNKNWSDKALLLSDIIYCSEDYRVCIENYLENYLNYYVVDSYKDALKGVDLLRDAQKGKANFFILNAVPHGKGKAKAVPGTSLALDHIECDEKYQPLLEYLLDEVRVIEEVKTAQAWLDKEGVFLAKDGSFSRKPVVLSGGSVGLFEGKKIGRKKHLEMLNKEIKRFESKADTIIKEIKSVQEDLNQLETEGHDANLDEIKEKIQEVQSQKLIKENQLTALEDQNKKDRNRLAELTKLQETYQAETAALEEAIQRHQKIIDDVKGKMKDVDDRYQKEAQALSETTSAFNEERIVLIRQENKIKSIEQELEFKERQYKELKDRIVSDNNGIAENEEKIETLENKLVELDREIKKIYEQRDREMEALSSTEQEYYQGREALNKLEETLRKKNRILQEEVSVINRLKDKLTQVKMQVNSLNDRVQIEFNSSLEEIAEREVITKFDKEELEAKCSRMKNRLDNYGEINPMAVEAYKEMKERYDSITNQRDDILEAKESLLDTIQEIETSATEKFLAAFSQVKENFRNVFQKLFTSDDDCDLVLEDPENPLDTKINIVAKPKGKRPQSISQLSGGEKTLTATAFLFALYLFKPAPFCVFDEVDAPLDDANIQKFNRIIKSFSLDSQFIIVTHNKLTMESVDVIYGVYMAEQGVSNVSGVDFRELTEEGELVEAEA